MSGVHTELESLSSINVLVIGLVIGIVATSSAFYILKPFQKTSAGSGNIEVENIQITSPKVGVGKETEVLASVKNKGDGAETRTLDIEVDGEVKNSKDITLASGETSIISFKIKEEKTGTYTVKIGKVSKNLEVVNHGIFTSKKYGFTIKYPNNWTFNKREGPTGLNLTMTENETEGSRPKAQAQMSAQVLTQKVSPLENIKKSITTQVENDENLSWISKAEITKTGDAKELELTVESKSAQGDYIIQQRIMRRENTQYSIQGFVTENNYETFKPDLELIIENLQLIGK